MAEPTNHANLLDSIPSIPKSGDFVDRTNSVISAARFYSAQMDGLALAILSDRIHERDRMRYWSRRRTSLRKFSELSAELAGEKPRFRKPFQRLARMFMRAADDLPCGPEVGRDMIDAAHSIEIGLREDIGRERRLSTISRIEDSARPSVSPKTANSRAGVASEPSTVPNGRTGEGNGKALAGGSLDPIDDAIIRCFQYCQEQNDVRRSNGQESHKDPGGRKVAEWLKSKRAGDEKLDVALRKARVAKLSTPWVLKRINKLKDKGLLTYCRDVADVRSQPLIDSAYDEDGNRVKDSHTPRQRRQRDESNEA